MPDCAHIRHAKKCCASEQQTMKVLYVGHDRENPVDYCPGSVLCLSCVQKLRYTNIRVQDTAILRKHSALPEWLNGTPILIDDENGMPMRGIEAYRFLQSLVDGERAHPPVETGAEAAEPPQAAAAAPPRMQLFLRASRLQKERATCL